MGTLPPLTRLNPKPDTKAELIERILTRTREEKVTWAKTKDGYNGKTRDGSIEMVLSFEYSILQEARWSRLVVTSKGKELLTYENTSSLLRLSGVAQNRAIQLIDELVILIEEQSLQGVRDAIAVLDRL